MTNPIFPDHVLSLPNSKLVTSKDLPVHVSEPLLVSQAALAPAADSNHVTATQLQKLHDVRVIGYDPLIQPDLLASEIPVTPEAMSTILTGRSHAAAILSGHDDRLLVIVGPCSVHDPIAGLEYAEKLSKLSRLLENDLCIMMRTYFEKPRTTVGWKGLINDPEINGTYKINQGLRLARQFLNNVAVMGVPTAVELLDTISPQYIGDLVAWGAIGARTTESQLHRELASGSSFPVGFKNGTDGRLQIAIDAIQCASAPHCFLGVSKFGHAAITKTVGNEYCHVILRGGTSGTNYDEASVQSVTSQLLASKLKYPKVMVDCSHGNSLKVHTNQISVASDIADQVARGSRSIFAVMIESFLVEGRQSEPNVYGKSITDACLSWEQTEPVLHALAEAVRVRRAISSGH